MRCCRARRRSWRVVKSGTGTGVAAQAAVEDRGGHGKPEYGGADQPAGVGPVHAMEQGARRDISDDDDRQGVNENNGRYATERLARQTGKFIHAKISAFE